MEPTHFPDFDGSNFLTEIYVFSRYAEKFHVGCPSRLNAEADQIDVIGGVYHHMGRP